MESFSPEPRIKRRLPKLHAMSEPSSNALINWNDLRPYIKLAAQNWWLFILLGATGYVMGSLITKRQLDVHNATSEILLESQETFDYQAQMLGSLGAQSLNSNVPNQQRILRSYDLIGRAVDAMDAPVDFFFVGRLRTTQVAEFSHLNIDVNPELFHPEMLGRNLDLHFLDERTFELEYVAPNGERIRQPHPFGTALPAPLTSLNIRFLGPGD